MKWPEHAAILFRKAAQDIYILQKLLDDPMAPMEVFGFHAQQAAEKLFKAVLVLDRVAYPKTHRLAELIDLIRKSNVALPGQFEELRLLSPFAVEFRYDVLPDEPEEPLDRAAVCRGIGELQAFVESLLKNPTGEA